MAAVANAILAVLLDQPFEEGLAPFQWEIAQVVSIEMEQIECVVRKRMRRALIERRLQIGKAGQAFLIQHDDLTIDNGGVYGQLRGRFGQRSHAMRPVEALAREEPRPALAILFIDMDLDAVAIELELVQPLIAPRRLIDWTRPAPAQEGRHLLLRRVAQY